MYREAWFLCSTSGHGCVHTYCPYFGKTADCTNASASVHWPWFSKKNLQPQGLQIFFREPWPKYKSFGIVQSLVFPKLGQVLIVQTLLAVKIHIANTCWRCIMIFKMCCDFAAILTQEHCRNKFFLIFI